MGLEGLKEFFKYVRNAFPDLSIAPEHMVATGDVAVAYTLTGTHQREYLGVEPTERQIPARGVPIAGFKDSKIVARRGSSDALSILQQLGAMGGQDEEKQKELTNKTRQVHELINTLW